MPERRIAKSGNAGDLSFWGSNLACIVLDGSKKGAAVCEPLRVCWGSGGRFWRMRD
jgi:hypothetical protein